MTPDCTAGCFEGYEMVRSVCVCVCMCVCDEKPCAHRESERWGSQSLTVVLEEGTWSEDTALLSRVAENQAPLVVQWLRICLGLQGRWV